MIIDFLVHFVAYLFADGMEKIMTKPSAKFVKLKEEINDYCNKIYQRREDIINNYINGCNDKKE